jgi:hypothetical protein
MARTDRRRPDLANVRPLNHAKGMIIVQEGYNPSRGIPLQYGATWVLDVLGDVDMTYSTTWGWVCDEPEFSARPPGPCHTVSIPADNYECRRTIADLFKEHRKLRHDGRIFVFGTPELAAWAKAGCQVDPNTGYLVGGLPGDRLLGDPEEVEEDEVVDDGGVFTGFEDSMVKVEEEDLEWPEDRDENGNVLVDEIVAADAGDGDGDVLADYDDEDDEGVDDEEGL